MAGAAAPEPFCDVVPLVNLPALIARPPGTFQVFQRQGPPEDAFDIGPADRSARCRDDLNHAVRDGIE
jgi:hypothetical protein